MKRFGTLLLITFFGFLVVESYRPVVIIHGILDSKNSLKGMAKRIEQMHPGTNVTVIDKLHGWRSMSPMWFQVQQFQKILGPIMKEHPEGINLIGYSQGGLIGRGLIQYTDDHNIKTFISLSSPQAGQFGDDFLRIYFPNYAKKTAYRIFYTEEGQLLSIGNYWRDPYQIPLYRNYSAYLAVINNEVETPLSNSVKNNFLKLDKLVMIGGPDDEIIQPWQSSMFGFYDDTENVVDMKDREIYAKDLFGLKTLDKNGKITKMVIPGVHHLYWHKNHSVIDHALLPHLD